MSKKTIVEFKEVSFSYPQNPEKVILDKVDWTLEEGGFSILMGPSGSGKSSFLRIINRLSERTGGQINIAGRSITDIPVEELRREVGMVFQAPSLQPGTVRENIGFGPGLRKEKMSDNQVIELLSHVGLDKELLNRPADQLSIGQQQRVAIAQSLANKPKILLMDEPTSALDISATTTIEDLIKKLHREMNLSVVFVTHSPQQGRRIGRDAHLLYNGKIIEAGAPEEFFDNPRNEITRLFLEGKLNNNQGE
jgi:UDP-glucose/iron transport system ATP-binding protein